MVVGTERPVSNEAPPLSLNEYIQIDDALKNDDLERSIDILQHHI